MLNGEDLILFEANARRVGAQPLVSGDPLDATAELVHRLPFVPAEAKFVEGARTPVLMDVAKARRDLRWRPRHSSRDTLEQVVAAHHEDLDGA